MYDVGLAVAVLVATTTFPVAEPAAPTWLSPCADACHLSADGAPGKRSTTPRAGPDVQLDLFTNDAVVDFEQPDQGWRRLSGSVLDPNTGPLKAFRTATVRLADHAGKEFRFRVAFGGWAGRPRPGSRSTDPAELSHAPALSRRWRSPDRL